MAFFLISLLLPQAHAVRRLHPPPGVVLHGGGQYPGNFESYSSYLGSSGPSIKMFYYGDWAGLNATPPNTVNPWFSNVSQQLSVDAGPDGAFICPQIGLFLGDEKLIASGAYDTALESLRFNLLSLSRPIFLRVGYEFNGPWNGYAPQSYVAAFRRLATVLHSDPTLNQTLALVWDGSCDTTVDPTPFFPGDDVVDWQGVNIFTSGSAPAAPPQSCLWYWITDSQAGGFPLMIGESTPRGLFTNQSSTWERWFAPFASLINQHRPGLVSYIDMDWEHTDGTRWAGWGDSRVEVGLDSGVGPKWKGVVSNSAVFFNRANKTCVCALLGLNPALFPL